MEDSLLSVVGIRPRVLLCKDSLGSLCCTGDNLLGKASPGGMLRAGKDDHRYREGKADCTTSSQVKDAHVELKREKENGERGLN
jgi:hypothetical protein